MKAITRACELLLALALCTAARAQTTVSFPDPALENAVRSALSKPDGALTTADLLGLTNLVAYFQGITNLAGLEKAVNLEQLDLHWNALRAVGPIAGLSKLTLLSLAWNPLSDGTALGGLTNLTSLRLDGTQLTNASWLPGLKTLRSLSLGSPVRDFSTLSNLVALETLNLSSPYLTNGTWITGLMSLTNLDIHQTGLRDVSSIASLPGLRALWLENNEIADPSPLAALTNLSTLSLSYNSLGICSGISGLTNLDSLYLRAAGLTNIADLSGLIGLQGLDIENNQVKDLTPLIGLTNLLMLSVGENPVTSFVPLSNLKRLDTLLINECEIKDINFLQNLTGLRFLYGWRNEISDLSPLSGLTHIFNLDLSYNQLRDISVLTNLPALRYAAVYGNLLDLSPGSDAMQTITQLNAKGINISFDPQNQAPSISVPFEWTIAGNTASSLQFYVSDDSTKPSNIVVSASSSNPTLLPNSAIQLTGASDVRTLTVVPAANEPASAVITLTAIDEFDQTNQFPVQIHVVWATNVSIVDPKLLWALRSSLGKYEGQLNSLDLAQLTSLSAWNITNLSGLEWAINLHTFWAENCWGGNFSPLSGLTNLSSLSVRWSGLGDCASLSGLPQLTNLDLSYTFTSDVSCLAQLTNLLVLDLSYNSVSNVAPLAGLTKLQVLKLNLNPLGDCSSLAALTNFTGALYLEDASITDLSCISSLANLTGLSLQKDAAADLSPLGSLTNLTWLDLSGTQITNWSGLASLASLATLYARSNELTSLAGFPVLPRLSTLDVRYNQLFDMYGLAGFTNLHLLNASYNRITNMVALTNYLALASADLTVNLLDLTPGSPTLLAITNLFSRGVSVAWSPQNLPPEFRGLGSFTVPANETSQLTFTIADDATLPWDIGCTAHSSNPNILSDDQIQISLSSYPQPPPAPWPATYPHIGSWVARLSPSLGQTGTTTITMTATDDTGLVSVSNMTVTVLSPSAFDGTALGQSNWAWTTFGTTAWTASTESHDGNGAARSGSSESLLRTSVTGPGTLTFWWKAENSGSGGIFNWSGGMFNARGPNGLTGSAWFSSYAVGAWKKETVGLAAGNWTLEWKGASSSGQGILLVDQVEFIPGTPDSWLELGYAGGAYGQSLMLHGEIGGIYDLETSSDLKTWSLLQRVTMYSFYVYLGENFDQLSRFYRARRAGSTAGLWIECAGREPSGNLNFVFHGPVGALVRFEVSQDLVHWSDEGAYLLGPNTGTASVDPTAASKLFFRLRLSE